MEPATLPATLGEFAISGVLGRGGSGIVYDATWGPRRVALKVLHASLLGTGKECAQFLAEAQRLQQIAHANVVKVLATGQLPDGRPYLAMEHLDGETLASVIARGALPLPRALEVLAELCSAVDALHGQGLVHRDLKPENVFVVAGRHAVLLDFGIAKGLDAPASTTTQEGAVRGTPAYMAPERFFGQAAGIPTDIYELAVTFYAMLAGRLPWDDLVDPEARLQPRPLVELASVPAELDIEVRRAMSTRAPNRPASARVFLDAVRAAAGGARADSAEPATVRLGARATPEQQTPLAWAPTHASPSTGRVRRRLRWIAGAIVVAAAAIGGAIYLRARGGEPPGVARTADATMLAADRDPWGGGSAMPAPPPTPIAKLALVDPQLTPETYRAEAAAAIARLPADTRVAFAAQITELRAQQQIASIIDRAGDSPRIATLAAAVPPCVRALLAQAEWAVFGAAELRTSERATLVVRGRWRRADVEACFASTAKRVTASDGAQLVVLEGFGWIDFVDEHTVYFSNRTNLDADAVHALVRHGGGPRDHARDLVARLPADRSLAFVIDGNAGDDLSMLELPKGSDLYGWIRADAAGAALDVAADPHDAAAAQRAEGAVRPKIEDLFANTKREAVGRLEVARDGTIVHVRGNLTPMMLGIVSMGLASL